LKSKNSKSVIPEKGMYLYNFCYELLKICIQIINMFTGEAGWAAVSPVTYWRVLPPVVYIKILNNNVKIG